MWNRKVYWLVFLVACTSLASGQGLKGLMKISSERIKRDINVFNAGASLAIDKAMEVKEALEHGVKVKQNTEHEIDFFGAKFENGQSNKAGYGDALKDKKQRRKRSELDDMDQTKQNGQEGQEDNVFVRMWKAMVQAAKNVAQKITDEVKSWNQNQTDPNVSQNQGPNY